jgi:hypothetical protein
MIPITLVCAEDDLTCFPRVTENGRTYIRDNRPEFIFDGIKVYARTYEEAEYFYCYGCHYEPNRFGDDNPFTSFVRNEDIDITYPLEEDWLRDENGKLLEGLGQLPAIAKAISFMAFEKSIK